MEFPEGGEGVLWFSQFDGASIKVATEQLDTVSDVNDGPMNVPAEQVQSFYDGYVQEVYGV